MECPTSWIIHCLLFWATRTNRDVDLFLLTVSSTAIYFLGWKWQMALEKRHCFALQFFEVTTVVDPSTNDTVVAPTSIRQNEIYVSVYVVWSKVIRNLVCTQTKWGKSSCWHGLYQCVLFLKWWLWNLCHVEEILWGSELRILDNLNKQTFLRPFRASVHFSTVTKSVISPDTVISV